MIGFVDKVDRFDRETGEQVEVLSSVRLGHLDNTPTACQREAGAISDNAEAERILRAVSLSRSQCTANPKPVAITRSTQSRDFEQ